MKEQAFWTDRHPGFGRGLLRFGFRAVRGFRRREPKEYFTMESLILAQDERWLQA